MKKISGSAFFTKKVFPFLFLGTLAVFFVAGMVSGGNLDSVSLPLSLTILAIFVFNLPKKLVGDLADEVYDGGDYLLFKKSGKEQRVLLQDVRSINSVSMSVPRKIAIQSRSTGPLGKELVFSPPIGSIFRSTHPLAHELNERVEQSQNS